MYQIVPMDHLLWLSDSGSLSSTRKFLSIFEAKYQIYALWCLQASFWLGAKKAKIQGFCDSFHGKGYVTIPRRVTSSKFFEFQCNHFFVFCTNSWILGKVKNVEKTSNGTWDVKASIVIEASFTVHHTFFEPHACLLYDSNHPPSFWKYSLHPEIM